MGNGSEMDHRGSLNFDALAYDRLAGPQLRAADPSPAPGVGAIVCLTRGYRDVRQYAPLIARNRSIYDSINRFRSDEYPLVIWHEGNVTEAHQRHILASDPNSDVRFVDVSVLFRLSGDSSISDLMEDWQIGYRLMCRFHIYHIWQCCRQFQYVMRIDEDCVVCSTEIDPIEWMSRQRSDFAAAAFVAETHELTNRTLPGFVAQYLGLLHPDRSFAGIYNHCFPYTNLYVTRTAFWLGVDVQRFLYAIIREPASIRFRWGDLPVLGVALNIFAREDSIAVLPKLVYRHGSHDVTVASASAC
jgi:hypothetical protein